MEKFYLSLFNKYSNTSLVVLLLIISFFAYSAKDFQLDASSDTLLIEGDPDLKYLNEISERYGAKEFLVLTYSPVSDFTDEETIINLQFLKSKLEKLLSKQTS